MGRLALRRAAGYPSTADFAKLGVFRPIPAIPAARLRSMANHRLSRINVFSQELLENLYREYLEDPQRVPLEWREFFAKESGAIDSAIEQAPRLGAPSHTELGIAQLQDRVDQLVRGFRVRGHLEAHLDPLNMPRPGNRELNPESYGLMPSDMQRSFSTRTISGEDYRTLEEIVNHLRHTYCRSIGAQFMHIDDHEVRDWLQARMERSQNRLKLSRDTQLRILNRLTDAVIFEEFVRKKYVGAKTFSLEGAETLIPLLDLAIEKAAKQNIVEIVLGMAHRGRLNVLANIMNKRAENIFWTFDDPAPETHRGGGDVLYHLGHSSNWTASGGQQVHLSLCFNPSHLEFVNPVAMGRCRSKQDRIGDHDRRQVMTLLIHGDAAFAGEGVVQETLNLSQLVGYKVGGTVHVIVNNQVGFTTDAEEGRSTTYASDVAKMLQIPIFHVNGEDPEAVAQVVELAMDFRQTFRRDVVIDMYCYRRLGHNESDEPRFTQPLMYQKIDRMPTVREGYLRRLLKMREVTAEESESIVQARQASLERDYEAAQNDSFRSDEQSQGNYWDGFFGGPEPEDDEPVTAVPAGKLSFVIQSICQVPESFQLNPKLVRSFEARREMADGRRPLDWATAELAAFGSLAVEGHPIRLSGQDSGRGTFSQRHARLHDASNGSVWVPLQHIADDQARVEIINSPLSEAGVLGFEYGYSLDFPEALVCWEAQFGDFWNAAQVIVDQFIASAEDKWRRLSGLTMLLPHGFEGAGPEHCSARLERFLTLAAEHNIQVVVPTTAAQYFHLLRRQVKRRWRKPLVCLTPKSLLREPLVASEFDAFSDGRFLKIVPDPQPQLHATATRVLLCTGKIAIDLLKRREQLDAPIAVVRVEQLYPLPEREIAAELERFRGSPHVVWVQEEPENMGAWYFLRTRLSDDFQSRWPLRVICRAESASPATGSKKTHKIEQDEILDAAMDPELAIAR